MARKERAPTEAERNVAAALGMLSDDERMALSIALHLGRQKAIESGRPYAEVGDFLGDDTDSINAFRCLLERLAE